MLTHTSTEWAPSVRIPTDRKWFARIGAAAVIADALIRIDPRYPTVTANRARALQTVKQQLEAEAPDDAPADPFGGLALVDDALVRDGPGWPVRLRQRGARPSDSPGENQETAEQLAG